MKLSKKLTSIFVIFILLLELVSPIVLAEDTTSIKYVAIGDTIAYGYGLADRDTESYPQIVRSKLNIPESNFKNLSVSRPSDDLSGSGMSFEAFYNKIHEPESVSAIKDADLITVSIGLMDLLDDVIRRVSYITGVDCGDPDFTNKVQQFFQNVGVPEEQLDLITGLYSYWTTNDSHMYLGGNVGFYNDNLSMIISDIKSMNPDATIIVTELYNPFYEVGLASYDLGNFYDEYIKAMNSVFYDLSQSESLYKIAKVYDDFNITNPRPTNINIDFNDLSKINFDIHPNKYGHSIIAANILDVIKTTMPQKKDIQNLSFSTIDDVTYTGKAITPKVQIKDGETTLTENTDYTLSYLNNTEVGEASIVIKGIGNYTGTVTKNFNIVAPQVIEKTNIDTLSFLSIPNQAFQGFKITPDVTIKDDNYTLKKGTDYSLTYSNNINVGTASIDVKGIGNYTGTKKITFTIIPKDISNTTIFDIPSYTYTGNNIIPLVSITDGSSKLIENKDYNVSYSNNNSVGTASVVIKGIGNYTGSVSKTFRILENEEIVTAKDVSTLNVSDIEDKTYTGKLITPEIKIYDNSTLLKKGVDYTLSYYNNMDVGKANVQIKGIGNYTGTITKTFNIVKKDINHTQISDISDQVYNGKKIEPEVIITSDSTKLIKDQDYTIEYENTTNVGTAKIKITGINNYTGSTVKTFEIVSNSSDDNEKNTISPSQTNQQSTENVSIKAYSKDNTTSKKELPVTGINVFAFALLISLASICIYSYKKYHINKDI